MITREQAKRIANVFAALATFYDPEVLDKVRLRVGIGNKVIIEWDDMSEDDVDDIAYPENRET